MEGTDHSGKVGNEVFRANEFKQELSVMEKTIAERGNLTINNIWKESVKILNGNTWSFFSIQLMLFLPPVILTICCAFLIDSHGNSFIGNPTRTDDPLSISWDTLLQFLLMCIVSSVVLVATYSLAVSANVYAVGLLFNDKAVSSASVLKGVMPRLWMRLSATHLCWLVPPILFFAGFHVLEVWIESVDRTVVTMFVPLKLVLFVCSVFLGDVIFMLVSGVCVFEEVYGWAALRRTRQLVRGKVAVACGSRLRVSFSGDFWVLIFVIGGGFGAQFSSWQVLIALSPWSFVFLALRACSFMYDLHLASISVAVTNVSFKAYHDSIGESSLLKCANEGGYQPIADGVDPADDGSRNESHPGNLV